MEDQGNNHNNHQEIEGVLTRFLWTDSDRPDNQWALAELLVESSTAGPSGLRKGDSVKLKGSVRSLVPGRTYAIRGQLRNDPRFGREFSVSMTMPKTPRTPEAMESMLETLPGIGRMTARALVSAFGLEALDVLRSKPWDEIKAELSEKLGSSGGNVRTTLTESKLQDIRSVLSQDSEMVQAELLVRTLLREFVSDKLVEKILKTWRKEAATIIEANPWRLVELRGITFETADAIARANGAAMDHPVRILKALEHVYTTHSNSGGHTVMGRRRLYQETCDLLAKVDGERREELVSRALKGLDIRTGEARAAANGEEIDPPYVRVDEDYVQSSRHARYEQSIAKILCERVWQSMGAEPIPMGLPSEADEWDSSGPDGSNPDEIRSVPPSLASLAPDQLVAMRKMLDQGTAGTFVLTGAPGTGKTWLVKKFVERFESASRVVLCAPTGKAARRLAEQTGMRAQTIHKTLAPTFVDDAAEERLKKKASRSGLQFVFAHDAENRLDSVDLVVVDEASMVDAWLFSCLLEAVPDDAYLLIVGDPNQLPSVGPGAVLRDVLSEDIIPSAELTEIKRSNPGLLLQTIHAVKDGLWEPIRREDDANLLSWRANTDAECIDKMVELYLDRLPKAGLGGERPLMDTQVLIPWKTKPTLSTRLFNERVQEVRKQRGEVRSPNDRLRFGVGDKVLQTSNDPQLGIVNGDIGEVVDCFQNGKSWTLVVQFDGYPNTHKVPAVQNDLELAYAVTVHKSQGSEWHSIIVPARGMDSQFFSRELFYTAISRAQSLCVIVGEQESIPSVVRRRSNEARLTGLGERLRQEVRQERGNGISLLSVMEPCGTGLDAPHLIPHLRLVP